MFKLTRFRSFRCSLRVSLALCGALVLVHAMLVVPSRANNLQPTSGPSGGPVGALVCASDGDLYVYAYGLYRSADHGASWSRVADLDPRGLAAGENGSVYAYRSNGVWRSVDDGASEAPKRRGRS